MPSVKQQLLAALAAELDRLSPGAGEKAAFESPKQAAHGDLACTAAMQLAKPLKANPRQLAQQLQAALAATPAFGQWVQAIEIAGPGFLNIRLHPALEAFNTNTAGPWRTMRHALPATPDKPTP